MTKLRIGWRHAAALAALSALLSGCGSSNNTPSAGGPSGGGGPPQTIQGIATPANVAVVTATNAN